MKSFITIVGTILIIFGIIGFSYKYFSYTANEKVAEIGSVKVSAEQEKTIAIPPVLSGLTILAGIVLVGMGINRRF